MTRPLDTANRNMTKTLALVLAFALLVCHGAMGSLHVVSTQSHAPESSDATPGESHALHGPGHQAQPDMDHRADNDGSDAGLLTAHHEADIEYFAVLSALFLAALLLTFRSKSRATFALISALADSHTSPPPTARIPTLPRGPTRPDLQVFRL